jgi:hypothetical protein
MDGAADGEDEAITEFVAQPFRAASHDGSGPEGRPESLRNLKAGSRPPVSK